MSLESDVASVLRNDPAGRINFRVDNIVVSKPEMERVAKAVEGGDISVVISSDLGGFGAVYSSYVGRRLDPGEKKLIGKISLGKADFLKSALDRAGVFHECVHALMDVAEHTVTMHNDEVVGYIADAMYLQATFTTPVSDAKGNAIYKAAKNLVAAHQLLTKPGVALTWKHCDELRLAIQAHPQYKGTAPAP